MASFTRFGFFLLILQIVSKAEVRIQAQGQETSTAENTGDVLKDIQARLLAIEQKLAQKYISLETHFKKLHEAEKLIQARDVVRVITGGSLKFAEEKLLEIDDPATVSEIVRDVYANSDCNFGALIDLVKSLTNTTLKSQILANLYDEVTRNNRTSTLNMIALAKVSKAEDVEEIGFPITDRTPPTPFQKLVDQITVNIVEKLANVLQSNENYEHNADVRALSAAIADWPAVSANVMKELVRITFKTVDHNKVLESVHSHANTFQAMVGVGELFWRLKGTGSLKDNIVLNIASDFSEIMNRTGYSQLDSRVKSSAERVVENFPACARNLFFQPTFCIWNKLQESFVFSSGSAYNYDDRRRNIFTASQFKNGTNLKGAAWRLKRIGDKLFFESVDYPNQNFYAADISIDADFHYVFGWIPGGNMDDQSAWTLELNGDYCFLKNVYFDEYLSGSFKRHMFSEYAYVLTKKKRDSEEDNSAFMWQIRNC